MKNKMGAIETLAFKSAMKEADDIMSGYDYNYTCRVGDEDEIDLNNFKELLEGLGNKSKIILIDSITDYCDKNDENNGKFYIFSRGIKLIKLITVTKEKSDDSANDKVKDILK